MQKATSTVIATIMLLMITVSLIGVFYAFSSTIAGTTTSFCRLLAIRGSNGYIIWYVDGVRDWAIGAYPELKSCWNYVTVTYDKDVGSNNMKLFVNGVQRSQTTNSTAMTTTSNDLFIGKYGSNNYYFNGTIDEVRIWNRALTPDETMVMKQII